MPVTEQSSAASQLDGALQESGLNAVAAPVAAEREVLKCEQCQLVQFRTVSDLCRRCQQPLPRPQSELQLAEELRAREAATAMARAADGNKVRFDASELRGKTIPEFPLGARLRELREYRNLTQMQVAQLARVPRTYVSRIEHAHLLPGLGVVQRLADALNVDILDLIPEYGNCAVEAAYPKDSYWSLLSRQFRCLTEEQKSEVLSKVRGLLTPREVPQPRPEPAMMRPVGRPIFRSVAM